MCLEFQTEFPVRVALIRIRSRFGPFSGRFPPKHAPGVPGFGHIIDMATLWHALEVRLDEQRVLFDFRHLVRSQALTYSL